jgi:hypothetical protein
MLERNRSALKEWASVERALAEGRVTLLLRKGGIYEGTGEFRVEHREFWIFPTLFHQNPEELRPEFRPLLGGDAPPAPQDEIPIGTYSVVEDAFRVERLDALERLEGLHPMTQETVRARFAYRGKPYLHALVVRAHRLPEPLVVPNTLGYEGCVSWVALDGAVATAGARPVLGDGAFAAARAEVARRLGADGVFRV